MKFSLNSALCALGLVLAPLALAMGCDSGGGPDEFEGADGGLDNDGSGTNDGFGTILAIAPNGVDGLPLVGEFTFELSYDLNCRFEGTCEAIEDALTCSPEVSSCEREIDREAEITFDCPNYLCLTKTVIPDPTKVTEVVWDDPGDCGLAPSGTYRDQENQNEDQATTTVEWNEEEGYHIELRANGSILGTVRGNSFSRDNDVIEISNGVISPDLKTISYHRKNVEANVERDYVLILVE